MKDIVVFHHDDADGFASALPFYILHNGRGKYIPVQYNQPVPNVELTKNTDLYIVDFSYPLKTLQDLQAKVGSILVIDHHKTSKEQLENFEHAIFDVTKAGAQLCWEYVFPNSKIPMLIQYVSDRDLWKFELKGSKDFVAGMKGSGRFRDLAYWDKVFHDDKEFAKVMESGVVLNNADEGYANSFSKSNKYAIVKFRGLTCALYNTTYLISEMAQAIYARPEGDIDMTMSYFVTKELDMVFSMRAPSNNDVDVGAIAASFPKGGGHVKAAGFSMSLTDGAAFLKGLVET